jgi:NAD(P)-dependent dehydrogenase (short-subunit alcohol dehydrogenase family)
LTDRDFERIREGPDAPGWDPFEAALLRAADELHRDSFLSDATWSLLASRYDTRQLMDVVFTVGQYTLAMAEACVARFGRIDVLHNHVGIGDGDGGPTHLSEETWDRIHAVNLKSMFLTCKHVLPQMRAQRSGVVLKACSPTRRRRPA